MIGTFVNVLTIILGSLLGILFKNGIPEKVSKTIMHGLALCVIYIGISGALKGNNGLLIIISIVIGAVIGEIIDIDKQLEQLGNKLESCLKGRGGKISEAFVTSSLLFCVGAMAIVGSLESGLQGNNEILYTKSVLDGVTSIIFASSLGIGVIFSSAAVLIYQGIITVGASYLSGILIQAVIDNMTAVGSLLILGLGLNVLGVTKIKVANLLPAVFVPVFYNIMLNIINYL